MADSPSGTSGCYFFALTNPLPSICYNCFQTVGAQIWSNLEATGNSVPPVGPSSLCYHGLVGAFT